VYAVNDWIVVIGGFSTPKTAYAAEMSELENSGKSVLFIEYDKDIESELRKKNIEQAEFAVYSYDCRMINFAIKHPERVKRLVLINAAGLIGKDTTIDLLFRFARQMVEETYTLVRAMPSEPQTLLTAAKVVWGFVGTAIRNLREVPKIAHSDIVPSLLRLRQLKVEVILLHAYSDRVFPKDRVINTLGEDPYRLIAGWAMFAEKDASHNVSYLKRPGSLRQILGW